MKKYTTPKMKINMFSAEEVLIGGSTIADPDYVEGLTGITEKTQINLSQMKTLTKFVF